MKTISKGQEKIIKLLGKQKIKEAEYRRMKYILQAECEDGVLLHNVITGHTILLEGKEANVFNNIPLEPVAEMTELIQGFFLVPKEYDEKKTVLNLRTLVKRLSSSKGIEGYTILTTTNCNARCFYCYENNLPHINMSQEVADKVVEYMIKHRNSKTLKLHWFGGEPLVCAARIDQICEKLSLQDIKYYSSMTSNGYLFTDQMIEKAVRLWNLKSVQITLDGTEEIYNKTKAYISVKSSPYRRVISNIKRLLDHGIRVIIRLNLDKHNINDLKQLILELYYEIKSFENVEVYSHILFENAGFEPIERDSESRELLYRRQIELNTELELKKMNNYRRSIPYLKTHNCMADSENSVVVYPDGRLFKCEHIEIGDEFGSLDSDEIKKYGIDKFTQVTELNECSSCPIFPSCILLKNCQGIIDKNRFTCKYEIESYSRALNTNYSNLLKDMGKEKQKPKCLTVNS